MFESSISLEQILSGRNPPKTTRLEGGKLFLYSFQQWQALADAEREWSPPSGETQLYVGLGSRNRARRIMQTGSGHRLYEPDPHRLQLFIEEYPDFFQNQCWKVGTGLWLQEGFLDGPMEVDVHPLIQSIYDPIHRYLASGNQELLTTTGLILQIGDLYYRDVVETFKQESRLIWPFQLGHWDAPSLANQLSKSGANSIFSINLIEGLPALSTAANMDYICWEIDPAVSPYQSTEGTETDLTRIYTYRQKNIRRLDKAGYKSLQYLPLASQTRIRRPLNSDEYSPDAYSVPVSFVGSSMKENAYCQLRSFQQTTEQVQQDWSPILDLIEDWKQSPPGWRDHPLEEVRNLLDRFSLSETFSVNGDNYSIPWMLAEFRAYQKRQDVVRTVSDHFEMDIWGDDGWKSAIGEHGTYRGPAGHGEEVTNIYNATKVNLDVNRIYQPDIITMRVFDVMACGAVIITEEMDPVHECFSPGDDCEVYNDAEQLILRIESLLDDDARRQKMANQARETIETEHSMKKRLSQMNLL